MIVIVIATTLLALLVSLCGFLRFRSWLVLCLGCALVMSGLRIVLGHFVAFETGLGLALDLIALGMIALGGLLVFRQGPPHEAQAEPKQAPLEPSQASPAQDDLFDDHTGVLVMQLAEQSFQLEELSDSLADTKRSTTDFVTNLSHEIRQPLTSILGFADMLKELPTQADTHDIATTIERNGKQLLELLSDVMDLANLESGKLRPEKAPCGPKELVEEVAELFRSQAQAKGVQLQVEYEGLLPEVIETDLTRLRQALVNLVGNALKFTHTGSVTLTTRLDTTDKQQPQLEIEIQDTGIGMQAELQEQLFRPFARGTGEAEVYAGTGLGLTICKHLLSLLEGTIEVASAVGQGSCFTLRIPIGTLENVRIIDPVQQRLPVKMKRVSDSQLHCKALLVEDSRDNQKLISFVLKKAGATVELANNGAEGVNAVMEAEAAGTPYDIVLMDMQMPVLNGFDATTHLRTIGFDRPIVALTALALDGDRERCLRAGCDDYITKPIDRAILLQVVSDFGTHTCELPVPPELANA